MYYSNYNLTLLSILVIVFLFLLFSIQMVIKLREPQLKERKRINENLDNEIKRKQGIIGELNEIIKTQTMNHDIKLTHSVLHVLNLYELSNIQIPVDIIENLSVMTFKNEHDIINYIETQRKHWKAECMKKLYQKDVKI